MIDPLTHPEFGPQLLLPDLIALADTGPTVVILHAPHRPNYALTAWIHLAGPLGAIFRLGEVNHLLGVFAQPDGTLQDGLGRTINAYTWKEPTT